MSSPSVPSSPARETATDASTTRTHSSAQKSASSKPVEFSVALTVHTVTKTKSTGKGKTKKESKVKKLSFSPQSGNYLEFLRAVLSKFSKADKVKISVRSVYPFAYYYKGISKTAAPTVETEDEYREFVDTLEAKKPSPVNILVDMAEVEMACAKKSSKGNDSDSEDEDINSATATSDNLSSFEKTLQEWISKLKNLHKGSYDPKVPGSQPYALTPFMYREWATYIVDHKATLETPPHIALFDVKSRHHTLLQSSASSTPSPSPSSGLELSQVTDLITAVAKLVNPRTSISTPSTPPRASIGQSSIDSVPSSTQVGASPSDLTRCLTYIAEHPAYGLTDVQRYEPALRQQGIAPDVIELITREDLTRSPIRMNIGDAERFKRACSAWWEAPDGKRQRTESTLAVQLSPATQLSPGIQVSLAAQPSPDVSDQPEVGDDLFDVKSNEPVRYEREFISAEGKVIGHATFWGLPMQRDEGYSGARTPPDLENDGKIYWVDEANGFKRIEVPADHFIPEIGSESGTM